MSNSLKATVRQTPVRARCGLAAGFGRERDGSGATRRACVRRRAINAPLTFLARLGFGTGGNHA